MNTPKAISLLPALSEQASNILVILGIILFVLLTVAFIVMIIRKQSVTALLPFFILPILMIGFPRISKVIGPGFELDTLQQEIKAVENNPHDELAKKKLSASLQKAESIVKPDNSTAATAESIAAAHLALGQPAKAQPWANAAFNKDPNSARAKMLQQQARIIRPATEVQKNTNS